MNGTSQKAPDEEEKATVTNLAEEDQDESEATRLETPDAKVLARLKPPLPREEPEEPKP